MNIKMLFYLSHRYSRWLFYARTSCVALECCLSDTMRNFYLKYDGSLTLKLKKFRGEYFSTYFADIFYTTEEVEKAAAAADSDYEGTKIGFVQLLYYNQALAIANGINMSQVKYMALQLGF